MLRLEVDPDGIDDSCPVVVQGTEVLTTAGGEFVILARWAGVGLLPTGAQESVAAQATKQRIYGPLPGGKLRPGETVWRVAKNYGTSVKRIVRSNRIDDVLARS